MKAFVFDWKMALLASLLFIAMIRLGFWQLHRADEHRAAINLAESRRQQATQDLESLLGFAPAPEKLMSNAESWQYLPVSLSGQWLPETFLVENQVDNGRNGYYAVAVMLLPNGNRVLVNRGWLPAPVLRSELPVVPPLVPSVDEVGEIYFSDAALLDEPVFAEAGWPKRIGRLRIPGMGRELGAAILPFVVRLSEKSPSALVAHWPVVSIAPEKNLAYAVQWFLMAAALMLCYFTYSVRRKSPNIAHGDT